MVNLGELTTSTFDDMPPQIVQLVQCVEAYVIFSDNRLVEVQTWGLCTDGRILPLVMSTKTAELVLLDRYVAEEKESHPDADLTGYRLIQASIIHSNDTAEEAEVLLPKPKPSPKGVS
jgi:hypothetical protein